jgi:phosphopantothenoylcysteine synthetase/decarboxylase
MTSPSVRVLTVVVCAAGPASDVGRLVELAQRGGWTVGVVATPAALDFLDTAALATLTGTSVRSEFRSGRSPSRALPEASAVVVAPATFNTVNKLAAGISDSYPLTMLAETIGRGVPVVVLPFVNTALAGRAPFQAAVRSLRAEGVTVLLGPDGWEPHPPGTGGNRMSEFPWQAALDACERRLTLG